MNPERRAITEDGETYDLNEADRLLGFAEFNLTKGKVNAALTLIGKARVALGSKSILTGDFVEGKTFRPDIPEGTVIWFEGDRRADEFFAAGQKPPLPGATMPWTVGRFVLTCETEGVWGYVTSWDTWEEAEVAFEQRGRALTCIICHQAIPAPHGQDSPCPHCGSTCEPDSHYAYRIIPDKFRLTDDETGRVWHAGARYEWEDAQT